MDYTDDIDKAINAHGLWKQRLLSAIETGKSEFEPSKVKLDNQCEFGKFYYSLPAEIRTSEIGKTIQKQHSDFHIEAASILELAKSKQQSQAMVRIGPESNYNHLSGQLIINLAKLKRIIKDK